MAAEQQHDDLKGKYDAVRARNSTLGKETKTLRVRFKELEEELQSLRGSSAAAERRCEQLAGELEQVRAQQTSAPRVGRAADATFAAAPGSAADAQVLDALERLTKLADERQRQIDRLTRELQVARSRDSGPPTAAGGRRPQVRSADGTRTPLPPIPPSRGGSRAGSRSSSMSDADGRASRGGADLPPKLPRPPLPRESAAVPAERLESAAAREVIEAKALLQAAEAEREELSHMNNRLRQKVEQLEAKVARTKLAETHAARAATEGGEDAEVQLAIEREEAAALRARLETAVAHKQEEIELLRNMMRETRRVFAEAIAKVKAAPAGAGAHVG